MTIKQILQLLSSGRYNQFTVLDRFSGNRFLFEFHVGYFDCQLGYFVTCGWSRPLSRSKRDLLVDAARKLGYSCCQTPNLQ